MSAQENRWNNDALRALIASAQQGDASALEQMVAHNTRLVHSIARRYAGRGVDYDDLYQLGCMGLVKAIQRFDTTLGVAFSTYAVPMITGEIRRFLRDDGAVRVSRGLKDAYRRARQVEEALKLELGTEPDLETWAAHMGVSAQELVFILDSAHAPVSLDAPCGKEDDTTMAERLPASADEQERLTDRLLLEQLLGELPQRERQIIVLRYFRQKTQSEIAQHLGISQVQVSRLESRILRDLRARADKGA
nr:SigB/SigF/SigG family RNA polymerase sigma factor [Maliibacterium massiliense]